MTGFTVAFDGLSNEEQITFPYIDVQTPRTETYGADNITYYKVQKVELRLYTKYKDITSENTLETKLTELELYYTKQDVGHIDDQSCYEVDYEIGV